ncbi:LysR family transcriptional regulator [Alicyclobacillus suci]|uniref:LysR family transcriptional regulator n=1 Tax=Alicyclobacillus suci TaxID=2816080 RepID=UPI001A8C487C|nr:LysR family transcriptional regulator [Alicyclobacillus suci]
MDIDQLKSFCAVVELRSFRQAAEFLQITQPGVSRRIKSLEDELGAPLLERGPHMVSLTPQGKRFFPYAERTVKILTRGIAEVLINDHQDELSIGASPTISHHLLPGFIQRFKVHHRNEIKLYMVPSNEVYEMLLDHRIELGFASAFFPHAQLSHERIFSERVVCIRHPDLDLPVLKKGSVTLPIPIIMNDLHTDPWRSINEYLEDHPMYETTIWVNNLRLGRELAKAGVGIAFLPYSDVANDLASGELVEVQLSDFELPHRPVYMVIHKDGQLSTTAIKFRGVVLEAIINASRT